MSKINLKKFVNICICLFLLQMYLPASSYDSDLAKAINEYSSRSSSNSKDQAGKPNGQGTLAARKDIDWGPYMKDLQTKIRGAWKPPSNISEGNKVILEFNIRKDGHLVPGSIRIISSPNITEERAAIEAILKAAPNFHPLPDQSIEQITVDFTFSRRRAIYM